MAENVWWLCFVLYSAVHIMWIPLCLQIHYIKTEINYDTTAGVNEALF